MFHNFSRTRHRGDRPPHTSSRHMSARQEGRRGRVRVTRPTPRARRPLAPASHESQCQDAGDAARGAAHESQDPPRARRDPPTAPAPHKPTCVVSDGMRKVPTRHTGLLSPSRSSRPATSSGATIEALVGATLEAVPLPPRPMPTGADLTSSPSSSWPPWRRRPPPWQCARPLRSAPA